MEIRNNNLDGSNREGLASDERLEAFAAAEMADRGPKDVLQTSARNTDTDAAALQPVLNPGDEEGDEDYDDEEDDTDALIGDDVDVDDDIDDVDPDDDDLADLDLDDEEDEEDDTL